VSPVSVDPAPDRPTAAFSPPGGDASTETQGRSGSKMRADLHSVTDASKNTTIAPARM
jgi:hypothetical protein